MFEEHKDEVEFFVVYIREAHPIDGHLPMEFGLIEDPVTDAERIGVANQCRANLQLPFPALVDRMDDGVDLAYHGWPDRLYLIDVAGKIAYAGDPGPFGFLPDELDRAIRALPNKAR